MKYNKDEMKTSKVKLTLFSVYRASRSSSGELQAVERMVGAYDVQLTPEGRVALLAASVPFNSKHFDVLVPKPGFGLLALFGIRDSIDELQRWRTIARNSHAEFAYADLWVDVGEPELGLSNRESLKLGRNSRFLNLRRTTVDFQKELLAKMQEYVLEEGGDPNTTMADFKQVACRPDLFDRLLWEDEQLKNMDVVVLPLADLPTGRVRQVAYLRPGAHIMGMTQGDDQVIVQLPAWMNDTRAATCLREAVLDERVEA